MSKYGTRQHTCIQAATDDRSNPKTRMRRSLSFRVMFSVKCPLKSDFGRGKAEYCGDTSRAAPIGRGLYLGAYGDMVQNSWSLLAMFFG
jgi:hypothetical protein